MVLPLILGGMAAAAGIGSLIGAARREGKERNPLLDSPDAEVIDPGPDGAFQSFLETIGRPGKIVNNVLLGNWEGAGRQAVDLLGDVVDAPLPGDWIPHISRREDKPEFSDVVGGMEPGLAKFLVDVGGGVATDPTMLLPAGAVGKASGLLGDVAGKGLNVVDKALPGTADAVAAAGRGIRSTFGAQRISPKVRAILDQARAGQGEATAGMAAIKAGPIAQLTDDEANIVGDIMDNLRWDNGKVAGRLTDRPGLIPAGAPAAPETGALERVALHPGVTPQSQQKITDAVTQIIEIGRNQAQRPGIFKQILRAREAEWLPPEKPGLIDPRNPIPPPAGEPATLLVGEDELPAEYLGRSWTGQTQEQAINDLLGITPGEMGAPNATKELKLKTPEQINDFMAQNPGMEFERNAVKRMAKRAESQGTLASRAEIGRAILGDDFAYADSAMRGKVVDAIRAMAEESPESAEGAKVLLDAFKGLKPRNAALQVLASANRVVKPLMVYGAFIPKFGAIVRNRLSGAWQTLSNPEARQLTGKMANPLNMGRDVLSALDDGIHQAFGFKRLSSNELTTSIDAIDEAMKTSGGALANAVGKLPPDLADAARTGVLDGFVSSEQLIKEMGRKPWQKKLANVMNWPGAVFKGTEDRMRLGMFLDLKRSGKSAEDAARIVKDTFYDYAVSSAANRTARDLIPFFQFPAKAIVQQGKFLAEKPAVATGISRAVSSVENPDAPVYPYMEGKLNIPLGLDDQGNQQFVSGFGLPFESLNMIPDASNDLTALGRSLERDTVGASQPLLKSAFGAVSGEDPYFQTGFGSYGKLPIFGDAGAAGRAYNTAAGTGLLQPIDSPARLLGQLFDDRRDAGTKALDLLTGANVVNVDPNRALQQQLQQELEQNPTVQSYRSFYQTDKDEATQALLHRFQDAKRRAKVAREHQAAQAADVR